MPGFFVVGAPAQLLMFKHVSSECVKYFGWYLCCSPGWQEGHKDWQLLWVCRMLLASFACAQDAIGACGCMGWVSPMGPGKDNCLVVIVWTWRWDGHCCGGGEVLGAPLEVRLCCPV